jgi:hypothetical protein
MPTAANVAASMAIRTAAQKPSLVAPKGGASRFTGAA